MNEFLTEYTPDLVGSAIFSKMRFGQLDGQRFQHIDGVIYISEKHLRRLPNGRPACGVVIYEGVGALEYTWKKQLIWRLANDWSLFRAGTPLQEDDGLLGYEPIEDIPSKMKLYEGWQLEYRRQPYLSKLSTAELRVLFQRILAVNSLSFVRGSWPKPSRKATADGLRRFQHIIEETNRRGTDMRELAFEHLMPGERGAVLSGLPGELVSILTSTRGAR